MYLQKDDTRMHEIMKLGHGFLQSFCLSNHSNQTLLHKSLDLFLSPGVSLKICFYIIYEQDILIPGYWLAWSVPYLTRGHYVRSIDSNSD